MPGARTFFIIGITSYHSAVERRVPAERDQQKQERDGAERLHQSAAALRSPTPSAASTTTIAPRYSVWSLKKLRPQ